MTQDTRRSQTPISKLSPQKQAILARSTRSTRSAKSRWLVSTSRSGAGATRMRHAMLCKSLIRAAVPTCERLTSAKFSTTSYLPSAGVRTLSLFVVVIIIRTISNSPLKLLIPRDGKRQLPHSRLPVTPVRVLPASEISTVLSRKRSKSLMSPHQSAKRSCRSATYPSINSF